MSLSVYEDECFRFLVKSAVADAAHDLAHIKRVVSNAKKLLESETADKDITVVAAWLHDCVLLPKNHPDRKKASTFAAEKASNFLQTIHFPADKIPPVKHAIKAHSFSAGIKPKSMEAKIVQDSDRLDALGAIGIARCFTVGGQLNRPLYNPDDPFCESRSPNDRKWNIDHFYTKLFTLPDTMNTRSAIIEGKNRMKFMKNYLKELKGEIQE